MNKKRIGAFLILGIIVLLYAATIILALLDSPFAKNGLMAALFSTIVLPVIAYAYIMITKQVQKKDDIE